MNEFDFISYVAQPFVLTLMLLSPITLFYLSKDEEIE